MRLLVALPGPNLFRPILAIKFYDIVDSSLTSVPIFDRAAALLGRRLYHKDSHSASLGFDEECRNATQAFIYQRNILSFLTILTVKHADAMLLAGNSPVLIPELLVKIMSDVKTVWDQDGKEIAEVNRVLLNLYVPLRFQSPACTSPNADIYYRLLQYCHSVGVCCSALPLPDLRSRLVHQVHRFLLQNTLRRNAGTVHGRVWYSGLRRATSLG